MTDLHALVTEEIPKGRQDLADSHTNLSHVAKYLETNYYNSEHRAAALEESKKFTTQSLASVAYQINTLAYNFLQALELQQQQLSDVNSQVNHLAQAVAIHKEKVARREVGVLTTNKNTTRQFKIIAPSNPERPIKYKRRSIDFTALDNIGHAVIVGGGGAQRNNGGTLRRSNHHSSATSLGSANNLVAGPAPTTRPPTPPHMARAIGHTGTLSRSNKEYRTPPQVAPPQVPKSAYGAGQGLRSGYASAQRAAAGSGASALQVGTVHPMHHGADGQPRRSVDRQSDTGSRSSIVSQLSCGLVTEPGMVGLNTLRLRSSSNSSSAYRELNLSHHFHQQQQQQRHAGAGQQQAPGQQHYSAESSSTLPPPPPLADFDTSTSASEGGGAHADWVPRDYLEKVVAVYDYRANKEDELSFYENSVIYVLKKNDDGWWEGVMDGVTGLFPGNYVESLRQ